MKMGGRLLFPYPINETLRIGDRDPLDYLFDTETENWVYAPGWWRQVQGLRPRPAPKRRRRAWSVRERDVDGTLFG